MDSNKKIVLVVGASGGIGNKVAETLLDSGYSVVGTYFLHQEKINNLNKYPTFSCHQLNLQQPDSICQLKDKIEQELFAIINCEGICVFENDNLENNISIWDKTIVAKLIKFLLSEDSDYLNGQVISLEGGYTNQDPTLLLEEEINK